MLKWKKPAAPMGPGLHALITRKIRLVVDSCIEELRDAEGWSDLVALGAALDDELEEILGRAPTEEERALIDRHVKGRVAWNLSKKEGRR